MKVTDVYIGRYLGPTMTHGARVAVRRANRLEWEIVEERNPFIGPLDQMSRIAERLSGASVVYVTTDERTGDVLMVVVSNPDAA